MKHYHSMDQPKIIMGHKMYGFPYIDKEGILWNMFREIIM